MVTSPVNVIAPPCALTLIVFGHRTTSDVRPGDIVADILRIDRRRDLDLIVNADDAMKPGTSCSAASF